jgi:hydroxyacylglutathione hydrolase
LEYCNIDSSCYHFELITADRIDGRAVLDVRQVDGFASGHVPDAVHVELGDLPGRAQAVPGEAVVMCGHDERAMTAAIVPPPRLGIHARDPSARDR